MSHISRLIKLNNEKLLYIKSMHTATFVQRCKAISITFYDACIVWN